MIENYTDMRNDIVNNDPKKTTKVESSDISTKNTDPEKSINKIDNDTTNKEKSLEEIALEKKKVELKDENWQLVSYKLNTPEWVYDFINRNNNRLSNPNHRSLNDMIDQLNNTWKSIDKDEFVNNYVTQLDKEFNKPTKEPIKQMFNLLKSEHSMKDGISMFIDGYENLKYVLGVEPWEDKYTSAQNEVLDTYMKKVARITDTIKVIWTHDWYDKNEWDLTDKIIRAFTLYPEFKNKRGVIRHFEIANLRYK
jgi:hypothetical protein